MSNDKYLSDLPTPLSRLYHEMLIERDPRLRFRSLIKVFAGLLKYISIICIADFTAHVDASQTPRVFRHSLEQPSLGHWATFIEEIIKQYRATKREFHVPALAAVLDTKDIRRKISAMIHLRNTYVHPDVLPSVQESQRLYEQHLPSLNWLLDRLWPILTCPLLCTTDQGIQVEMRGHKVDPVSGSNSSFLVARQGEEAYLDITPFLLISVDSDFGELLLYETLAGSTAKYVLGNHLDYRKVAHAPARQLKELVTRMSLSVAGDTAQSTASTSPGMAPEDVRIAWLHELAKTSSDAVFNSYVGHRYIHDACVPRRTLDAAYTRLLNEDKRVLVIVSDSGGGKSTELCSLYHRLVTENPDDVVLLVSGRTLGSDNPLKFMEALCMGTDPGPDAQTLLRVFDGQRTGQRFVVLFDGLNETDQPAMAFTALVRLVLENDYKWLKLVLTCRSYTWQAIENTWSSLSWSQFVTEADGALGVTLTGLSDEEFILAAAKYGKHYDVAVPDRWTRPDGIPYPERKLLRSPLILRLAFQVFAHRSIPTPLDVDRIMRLLTENCTRTKDRRFVYEYLMTYFYDKETDVLDANSLISAAMERRAVSGDATDDAYLKLEEHILGDQVFDVEWLLRCDDKVCKNSGRPFIPELPDALCARCGAAGEPHAHVWLCPDEHCRGQVDSPPTPCMQPGCNGALGGRDGSWFCDNATCVHSTEPAPAPPHRCPSCGKSMRLEKVDNRSTYSKLLDENVISCVRTDDTLRVRVVFDRYFEHLMAQYCFDHKMHGGYDSDVVRELFEKARRSPIFVEPVKAVVLRLWRQGDDSALYQVAEMPGLAAYYVLRSVFEDAVVADFDHFEHGLMAITKESGFNVNICRAGAHALLHDAEIVGRFSARIVELLLFLSACEEDRLHEDVADYLVSLRGHGHDLLRVVIDRCAEAVRERIGVVEAARAWLRRPLRTPTTGLLALFAYSAFYALGNFSDDGDLRLAVTRHGGRLVSTTTRHPLLSMFRPLIARGLVAHVSAGYRSKGPLPCNYFEMQFQLTTDRDRIRRAGDLFLSDCRNVFDLEYDEFLATVHSENGLVSWYMLSVLPLHFTRCPDKVRALEHLKRLLDEGTEIDRYVAADSLAALFRKGASGKEFDDLLDHVHDQFRREPEQVFLNPEPLDEFDGAREVARYIQAHVERLRRTGDPYLVPWIVVADGKVRRFYFNWSFLHFQVIDVLRHQQEVFAGVLDLLEANLTRDVLQFCGDLEANRRFVASFVIRALALAPGLGAITRDHSPPLGCLREVLNTLERVIREHVQADGKHVVTDPELAAAYRRALVESLEQIKEHHRAEVLAFLERFDLGQQDLEFLGEVRSASVDKERMFSKSVSGHHIYQAVFAHSPGVAAAFGELTRAAADAKTVEDFFYTYTVGAFSKLARADVTTS